MTINLHINIFIITHPDKRFNHTFITKYKSIFYKHLNIDFIFSNPKIVHPTNHLHIFLFPRVQITNLKPKLNFIHFISSFHIILMVGEHENFSHFPKDEDLKISLCFYLPFIPFYDGLLFYSCVQCFSFHTSHSVESDTGTENLHSYYSHCTGYKWKCKIIFSP